MSFTTIIDASTLAAHLADPDWLVVDVRHQLADVGYGERAYRAGHIPSAVFMHCDRDLSGPATGINGRHPLPDREVLAEKLGLLGLGESTQVVIYDDSQGMIAGRLWWLLRWLGHTQVAVLDGGWQSWGQSGNSASPAIPQKTPCVFVPVSEGEALSLYALKTAMSVGTLTLVDARSPDRFRGENETIDPVGGHIPGAKNRFFRDNLAADGRFKTAERLRDEWQPILATTALHEVVHYCGSGVSACHNLLALEIAGFYGSRLYAGSWSEWCSNPERGSSL